MTRLPSKVQTGACSSSSTRSLKCVPLALSSSSWAVRYESGLVRVVVVRSIKNLEPFACVVLSAFFCAKDLCSIVHQRNAWVLRFAQNDNHNESEKPTSIGSDSDVTTFAGEGDRATQAHHTSS